VQAGKSKWVTVAFNGDPLQLHSCIAYRDLGNYSKALEEIELAKSYNPYCPRIYTTMGIVYSKLKEYKKAISCYQQALKLSPQNEAALKNLAVVYFELGQYGQCLKILKKLSIKEEPYFMYLLNEAKKATEDKMWKL
jgi:tetratricopeptide (TPR) repeat protein